MNIKVVAFTVSEKSINIILVTLTKHPIDKMNVGHFSHGHFGHGGFGQDISTTETAKGGRFGHNPKFGRMVGYLFISLDDKVETQFLLLSLQEESKYWIKNSF